MVVAFTTSSQVSWPLMMSRDVRTIGGDEGAVQKPGMALVPQTSTLEEAIYLKMRVEQRGFVPQRWRRKVDMEGRVGYNAETFSRHPSAGGCMYSFRSDKDSTSFATRSSSFCYRGFPTTTGVFCRLSDRHLPPRIILGSRTPLCLCGSSICRCRIEVFAG